MGTNSAQIMRIDIWSDVMCPWCLIGWGNLQKGLALLDDQIEADIHWRAFELNPDMPQEGEERSAHMARKYGASPAQSKSVQGRMREAAQNAGVSLDYEGPEPAPIAMMWNTFLAHKLLVWAGAEHGNARQTQLKLALFKAHFNERRKIGKQATLLNIADEAGFDRAGAEAALASEAMAEQVRLEERQAMELNITGVPAVLVEGKFLIPGAQPPATFADVLQRLAKKANTLA